MRYDHFHAELETTQGIVEVEGGFIGFPRGYEDMHLLKKETTLIRTALDWNDEKLDVVKLIYFRIAG